MSKTRKQKEEQLLRRISDGFAVLFSTVFLLMPPFLGYQKTTTVRYPLYLILCGGYVFLCAVITFAFFLIGIGEKPKKPREKAPFLFRFFCLALLFYVLWTVLSSLFSPYDGTFWGLGRKDGVLNVLILTGTAFFLACNFRPKRWMLLPFGISLTLFCLFSFLQFAGLNPLGLYPGDYTFYDGFFAYAGQYFGTLGNSDFCAAVLALGAGISEAVLIRRKTRAELLFVPCLFFTVSALLFCFVEAGIAALLLGTVLVLIFAVRSAAHLFRAVSMLGVLALAGGAVTAFPCSVDGISCRFSVSALALLLAGILLSGIGICGARFGAKLRFSVKRYRTVTLSLFAAGLAAGIVSLRFWNGAQSGTLFEIHEMLCGRWDDTFGSGRIYIWRQTLQKLWERPIFGGGPDTLSLRGLEPFRRIREDGSVITRTIDAAHCEYLNVAVNQGIPALLAYLTAIGTAAAAWIRSESDTAAIAGAGALFYLIDAIFGISFFVSTPYLWVCLGLLMGTVRRHG